MQAKARANLRRQREDRSQQEVAHAGRERAASDESSAIERLKRNFLASENRWKKRVADLDSKLRSLQRRLAEQVDARTFAGSLPPPPRSLTSVCSLCVWSRVQVQSNMELEREQSALQQQYARNLLAKHQELQGLAARDSNEVGEAPRGTAM